MYRSQNPRGILEIDKSTKFLTVAGVEREVQFENMSGRENTEEA